MHQTSQVVCTHSKRPSENTESLAEVAEDLGGELEEAVKQPFIHMRHGLMLWQISKNTLVPGLLSHAVQRSKSVLRLSDKTGYHIASMHGIMDGYSVWGARLPKHMGDCPLLPLFHCSCLGHLNKGLY